MNKKRRWQRQVSIKKKKEEQQDYYDRCVLRRGSFLEAFHLHSLRDSVDDLVNWENAKRALRGNRIGKRDSLCYVWNHPSIPEKCVCAIVNGYSCSQGAVAHHSDDEPQICQEVPILTYSFGSSMIFEIKRKSHKKGVQIEWRGKTGDSTLIVMKGQHFQKDYTHSVLPDKSAQRSDYRISVSLRLCWFRPTNRYAFHRTELRTLSDQHSTCDLEQLARLCTNDALTRWRAT